MKAEDETWGAIRLHIESEDDLRIFEEYQYMIRRPLCICPCNEEILEKALRIYNGRALFDNTCEMAVEFLHHLSGAYGLICL